MQRLSSRTPRVDEDRAVTLLTIFYKERGASVSMAFDTEAEARQELALRAGDMKVTGRYGGKLLWGDYIRATYTIDTP